jgi:hypothetical protein
MGGSGGVYSLNYERLFTKNLSVRAGTAYFAVTSGSEFIKTKISVISFPITVNYLFAKRNHTFLVGAGPTIFITHFGVEKIGNLFTNKSIVGTAILGYCYQPPKSRYNFRMAFTPIFNGSAFTPWMGISLGYGF